jgi:hypothetical protein
MKVIFRKFRNGNDVIAIFTNISWKSGDCNYGMHMSYQHIGQHAECNYFGILENTVLAKPEEYSDLQKELERIYQTEIVVMKKMQWR